MARVACSAVTWGDAPFEHVLDDLADAGYAGVETRGSVLESFARQPARLGGLLEERSLALAASPFSAWYFDRAERRDELERLRRLSGLIAEAAGNALVVFCTVPHPARRDMVAGEPPLLPLTPDRLAYLADALNQYCDLSRNYGISGAIQNRVGSFLETPDEYEAIIERTDPQLVWLAPDLGHWVYSGGDAASLVRTHRERIAYLKLKDFQQPVFDEIRQARRGFVSFLDAGGFKELGEGSLQLESALAPLVSAAYGGWVCVELERTARPAKESARISRDYLRDRLHW